MPITNETIVEANHRMLGKTNRAILFATVNVDEHLDLDAPEEEIEYTPSLASMLARIHEVSSEEFLSEVREKLTVRSFNEFIEKFQPGFYYRVRPAQVQPSKEFEDTDPGESAASRAAMPQVEFSLHGGIGWKKVRITREHPYIACLTNLVRTRVRQDISTFRVDVDASLFAFKPKYQRGLLRKLAEELQHKNDRLMLEAKRNPASSDTKRALEAYQVAAEEFQEALEDVVRMLPTVVYGLEQTAKELKRQYPSSASIDSNVYQIEFGLNRSMIASPQSLPLLPSGQMGNLEQSEGGALEQIDPQAARTVLAIRSIESAIDIIRDEIRRYADTDLALLPAERRFPATVIRFVDRMIQRGYIQPFVGSLIATVLQNPKELAFLSPDIRDVEHFHDLFLGIYSNAVEELLKTITPLFETLMGVYLLFNEFPTDVRLPDARKPELIVTNADLSDLLSTHREELTTFLDICCAQATNQFRDAISFAIVPSVAEFERKRPRKKRQQEIMLDEPLISTIMEAQQSGFDDRGYGRTTYLDEIIELMHLGHRYGFQILCSPEERVRAGHLGRDIFHSLNNAYAIDSVVNSDAADSLIMCVPDFVIMPPDGKLVTGKTADGQIEIGVDVPEVTARSCYIAAGILMANDVPDYLRRKLQRARRMPSEMRQDLPGVGIDLTIHPHLGETSLPTDHFLNDGVLSELLRPDMPFLVFTHVSGRSPFLSVPRTMHRVTHADGSATYRPLHQFRQQIYLSRLLRAAYELGFAGAFPNDDNQAEEQIAEHLSYIIKWARWYDPDRIVNSFPSKLLSGREFSVRRMEKKQFQVILNFEQETESVFEIDF